MRRKNGWGNGMRLAKPKPLCGRLAAVAAVVFLFAAPGGCGRKMPPIQPGAYPPPAVKNLAFEVQDDNLTLFWTLPVAKGEKESPAVGFKILRARQTESEAECQTCSVRFLTVGNVGLAGKDPSERLQFRDRLEPGYKYRYKVIGYSDARLDSKDSNVVYPTP
jgi:hypothetical protein